MAQHFGHLFTLTQPLEFSCGSVAICAISVLYLGTGLFFDFTHAGYSQHSDSSLFLFFAILAHATLFHRGS